MAYTAFTTQNPSLDLNVAPGSYAAQHRFVSLLTGQATELESLPVPGVALALEQGGADERLAARKKAA